MAGTVKKDGATWFYIVDLGKDANGKRRQKKKRHLCNPFKDQV